MEHTRVGVERITVSVPRDMAEALRAAVERGDYPSTGEAVREALRGWARARESDERALAELRALIQDGIDSGPPIPAEDVFAELHARYAGKN